MKGEDYKYIAGNQNGFVRLIVNYISRGYEEFHVGYYPINKMTTIEKFDDKIILKYRTKLSSRQRNYRKQKGEAVFVYLRFEHVFIILKSNGIINKKIKMDDKFIDLKQQSVQLEINDNVSFSIRNYREKITVFLAGEMIKNTKKNIEQLIIENKKYKAIASFKMLNGLPRFSGVISQQIDLQRYVVQFAKKHKVKISDKDLLIRTKEKNKQQYKN